MLFDLRGKRQRLVQVVYSLLAAFFLIGFVFFGIGIGGIGSVSDLLRRRQRRLDQLASSTTRSTAPTSSWRRTRRTAPRSLKLAQNEYFKAKSGVTQDPTTGQIRVSADAHTELGQSADAWAKYLKVNKGKPDPGIAARWSRSTSCSTTLRRRQGPADRRRGPAEPELVRQLAIYHYSAVTSRPATPRPRRR